MSGPKRFFEWLTATKAKTAVQKSRGRILAILLVITMIGGLLSTIFHILSPIMALQINVAGAWYIDLIVVAAAIGLWMLNRFGFTGVAGTLVALAFFVIAHFVYDPAALDRQIIYYTIPVLLAAFIIHSRFAILAAVFAAAQYSYTILNATPAIGYNYFSIAFLCILTITIWLTASLLESFLKESESKEKAQTEINRELQTMRATLEQRVAEQTRNLEHRATRIQAVADIAHDASSSQNVDGMLNYAARLIRASFGCYHVGLFLVDENNEFAALRAAGGDAGQVMQANKYRIRVDETNLVGHVISTGEPYTASAARADAFRPHDSLLPYTQSEIALPLKIGARVIGVLDIQSDKTNAFDQEESNTLQTITDQLAVAVERMYLLETLEKNAVVMESMSQQLTTRTWKTYLQRAQRIQGYHYEGMTPEPINSPPPGSQEALKKGNTTITKAKDHTILSVPIKLRGQTLGVLNLRYDGGEVPKETAAFVEEVANRLALALENARLVEDAQRLAAREKQINIITAQAQQSADLEVILQNTIRELGNTLGVPRAFIQIGLASSHEPSKGKN